MATKLSEAQVRIFIEANPQPTEGFGREMLKGLWFYPFGFDKRAIRGLCERKPALLKQQWVGMSNVVYQFTPEGEKVRAELLAAKEATPAQPPADTPPTLEDVLCDQPQPFIVSSLMLKFLSSGEFIYLVREIVREGYSIPEAQTIAKHLNAQADKEWLVTRNTQPAATPPAAPSEEDVEVLDWHAYSKDLMRRFLDCRNERDDLRRKLDELTSYITAALAYFDNPEFVNATDMTYSERMAGVWSQLEATKGASDG